VEVAEGIHRLTKGIVNFYLVEEGGKLTLVDAGAPRDWALLDRTISELGRGWNDLDTVLLTHAHPDHTGVAERARATASATVRVHTADAAVARGARQPRNDGKVSAYLLKAQFYRTTFSLVWRGASKVIPIREVATIGEGETLDVPGRPRVVNTPGHTPGTCALFLEERRVLFTGDALLTWNPLTGRPGPQISQSGFNRDTPQALRSLAALEGISAELILPGHGDPWTEGVPEALRKARAAGPS